jgi:hypothetical protein
VPTTDDDTKFINDKAWAIVADILDSSIEEIEQFIESMETEHRKLN